MYIIKLNVRFVSCYGPINGKMNPISRRKFGPSFERKFVDWFVFKYWNLWFLVLSLLKMVPKYILGAKYDFWIKCLFLRYLRKLHKILYISLKCKWYICIMGQSFDTSLKMKIKMKFAVCMVWTLNNFNVFWSQKRGIFLTSISFKTDTFVIICHM